MRKLVVVILAFAAIVAGVVIYVVAATPRHADVRQLLAQVPQSAEAFALIPTAAALEAKLRANPITRDEVEQWEQKHSIPARWLLGGADVLLWRDADGATHYLVRADPIRSLFIGNENSGPPIDANERDAILALANGLPHGDALVVQRTESRGAFPPIARPAVTSVSITENAIELTSRAQSQTTNYEPPTTNRFPRSALLTATFAQAPRMVDDLNRLFGAKVSPLLENGGTIAVYDVDTRKLLPRPLCVIAVPADDARRAALNELIDRAKIAEAIGIRLRTAEKDGQLLLSFDDSIDTYLKDAFAPARWPANRWSLRMDAQRAAPIARDLSESIGLRVASPRLFRSARDLERWIGGLERASTIEAADSDEGAYEVLKVRIAAK